MQTLFKIFLVLNLLAETLAAVSLAFGGASTVMGGAAPAAGMWSMHYGFAVICIASAIFWVWGRQTVRATVTPVLGMLMIFHLSVLTSLALEGSATQMVGIVIHSVLAILAVVLFTQRGTWCTD